MQNVILGTVAAILGSSLFVEESVGYTYIPIIGETTDKPIPKGKQAVKVEDFTKELHNQLDGNKIGSTSEKRNIIIKGLNSLSDADLVKIAVAHESMFGVPITKHINDNKNIQGLTKEESKVIGRISVLGIK